VATHADSSHAADRSFRLEITGRGIPMPSDIAIPVATKATPSIQILNGRFDRLSAHQTVEELVRATRARERGVLSTVNVAILMMMRSDPRLQRFVDTSRWTVADGQPLVWASHLWRQPLPERVAGIVLGLPLNLDGSESPRSQSTRAFARNIADLALPLLLWDERWSTQAVERMMIDADISRAKRAERVDTLAAAHILQGAIDALAMGVPRQEYFIDEQWKNLGARIVIGVGGSFDVIAGRRKRAPPFIQRAGLEWAYRLAQEPRRLFRRYLITNSQFLGLISRNAVARAFHLQSPIPRP